MPTKAFDIKDSSKVSELLKSSKGETLNPSKTKWSAKKPGPGAAMGLVQSIPDPGAGVTPKFKATPAPKPMDDDMSQPGTGEQIYAQYGSSLFGPTNSQGVFDAGAFNSPTASEGFYQQNAGQFATPGAAENWFAQNQGEFKKPGAAEDFYAEHKGDLENMPDPTNRAEEAYQASKARRPEIDADPGLEPYYDEAIARGSRSLNKRAAAMGNYGSSVALGEVGNLVSGLEAEMANRKADYNLRRIAEQRAWEQLGGEMASSADRSSLGISQNELSQLLGMGGLAQNAQQGGLSRLLGASGAASAAQGAQTSRLSAGTSAAGAASNADLARQGLALNAANSADSQNRANTATGMDAAFKSQAAREGRITGGFSNLFDTVAAILSVTDQGQEKGISSDEAYRDALQAYDQQKVDAARAKADAEAQRDTAMWIQIFTTALAAI